MIKQEKSRIGKENSEYMPEPMTAQEIMTRFSGEHAAAKYAKALPETSQDKREKHCINLLFKGLKPGSTVLDMPSGTGRMLSLFKELGMDVVSSDSSEQMLQIARENAEKLNMNDDPAYFVKNNALSTNFSDNQFDATLCNRLIHHLSTPADRQQLFKELKRITKGPIVVSFFCNQSWDAMTFRIKHYFRNTTPKDRIPISMETFKNDVKASGLEIVTILPSRKLISKQWYAHVV